jgi:hypothetical protein
MLKVSAALQLSMLAILPAIPLKADSLFLSNNGLSDAVMFCCDSAFSITGEGFQPLSGLIAQNPISVSFFVGFPLDETTLGIQTGDLVDSTTETSTFSGGTVTIKGIFFSRDAPDICAAQGGKPFSDIAGTIWCNYGSILSGTGVLLGDFTITATGIPSIHTFAGIAQLPFVPVGSSLPTELYQGPLTGHLISNGLSDQFGAGFDLSFRGVGTPVPEPSSILMLGTVIALVVGVTGRSFRRRSPIRTSTN